MAGRPHKELRHGNPSEVRLESRTHRNYLLCQLSILLNACCYCDETDKSYALCKLQLGRLFFLQHLRWSRWFRTQIVKSFVCSLTAPRNSAYKANFLIKFVEYSFFFGCGIPLMVLLTIELLILIKMFLS